MEKIIGFRRATGTYEGKPYDNFYLVTTTTSRKYYGVCSNETKVKASIVVSALVEYKEDDGFSADLVEEHPQLILGAYIEFYYNRFGQVTDMVIDECNG